jgi:hypothetical protein
MRKNERENENGNRRRTRQKEQRKFQERTTNQDDENKNPCSRTPDIYAFFMTIKS